MKESFFTFFFVYNNLQEDPLASIIFHIILISAFSSTYKWTLFSDSQKYLYHAQFHTVIPSDSIPPKFLTPVANREGIYQRCSGNTATQSDSSTLYLVRENSDEGRDTIYHYSGAPEPVPQVSRPRDQCWKQNLWISLRAGCRSSDSACNNFSVKFTSSRAPAASPDQSRYASDATATIPSM